MTTEEKFELFSLYSQVCSKLPKAKRVFTEQAVCWLMIQQSLEELSMEEVLRSKLYSQELQSLFGDCKRAKGKLSENTSAYAQARKELPLEVWLPLFQELFLLLNEEKIKWKGRPAVIMDGTTISLPPTPELRKAYPPAHNQHGSPPYPEMLVTVAHDLNSGLAYPPHFGPRTGKDAVSEIALGIELIRDFEDDTIIVADRYFGIFRFAFSAVKESKDVVCRLTQERAESLIRRFSLNTKNGEATVQWTPSALELKRYPELSKEDSLPGRLIVRMMEREGMELIHFCGHRLFKLPHAALQNQQAIEIRLRNAFASCCKTPQYTERDLLEPELLFDSVDDKRAQP